jgi:hypothetical protein
MEKIQELESKIELLETTIKELVSFMNDKKQTQIKMPLDVISTILIQKNLPVYQRTTTGAVSVGGYITCIINGLPVNILIK